MRRWIWRALLLVAVMAALTVGAAAADNIVTEDGIKYNLTTGTVLGPVNKAAIVNAVIPAEVKGVPITSVAPNAFQGCGILETVEIGKKVVTIGEGAFNTCVRLKHVYFSKNCEVTTIEKDAFSGCKNLNEVILPSQLTVIKAGTFSRCSALDTIYIPANVTTIEATAFYMDTELTVLHYGDLTKVPDQKDAAPRIVHSSLLGHPEELTAATCTADGKERVVASCETCGIDIITEEHSIPATGHKPGPEVAEVPANCAEPGTKAGKYCTVCGKPAEGLGTIKINPDNHKTPADQHIDIPEVKPTCTEPGSKGGKRCPDCLKVTTQPTVDPATGHKHEKKTVTIREATCSETGLSAEQEICSVCQDIKACETCEKLKGDQEKYEQHIMDAHGGAVIQKKDHTPGESKYVVTTPATCEKEGEETWKVVCSVCKQECGDDPMGELDHPARPVPALGHDLAGGIETITKEPTCTEPGEKTVSAQKCKREGCDFEKPEQTGVKVDPLGHDWKTLTDPVVIEPATCTKAGTQIAGIRVCQREDCPLKTADGPYRDPDSGTIEPILASGHTWETPKADPDKESEDKAPTCGEEGVSHVITTCTVCGETKRQEIKLPATGKHNYEGSEWTTVKNPTATEDGLRERPCMNPGCTHKDSQIIPATGNPSDPDNPDDPNKPTDPEKPKTYSITLVQGAGGTASVSRTTAQEGDRITVTLSPNSGYELDMIRAIGGGTDVLSLTDLGGGQHRFTMPASNVEIRVTFERTNSGSGWASAPGDSSGGSDARRTSDVMPTQNATLGAPQAWASEQRFRDVPVGHWAAGEIEWANQMGYMNGTGGRFNPNGNITNQQMWMILARLTGSNPANMAEAQHWAVQGGYADGSSPTGPVKRHQLVTALYRCARLSGSMNRNTTSLAGYNDSRNVPAVARDAFSWALANGIVSGSADKNLMPNGYITRAQFAVILYRYSQRV